jgi:restriction system protein
MSDPLDFFDTVAINAHQNWFDPATGNPKDGIIASLQAKKLEIQTLQPGHLDAKACFRHLAGIATPNLQNAAPVRPVFVMDTADNRIVRNKDIAAGLEDEANLATMPWEDFEHLVRQLFEWMFASGGVDVVATRASRDRGVDAIMFDPDPVRGGKYVLQAKRYTRTVDVAAVRDLYGTVVNEGANRGILVTTASYGPDAYEFAKNKPISLIDGPNLIAMLRKHGRSYRIDLDEARMAESDQQH